MLASANRDLDPTMIRPCLKSLNRTCERGLYHMIGWRSADFFYPAFKYQRQWVNRSSSGKQDYLEKELRLFWFLLTQELQMRESRLSSFYRFSSLGDMLVLLQSPSSHYKPTKPAPLLKTKPDDWENHRKLNERPKFWNAVNVNINTCLLGTFRNEGNLILITKED